MECWQLTLNHILSCKSGFKEYIGHIVSRHWTRLCLWPFGLIHIWEHWCEVRNPDLKHGKDRNVLQDYIVWEELMTSAAERKQGDPVQEHINIKLHYRKFKSSKENNILVWPQYCALRCCCRVNFRLCLERKTIIHVLWLILFKAQR